MTNDFEILKARNEFRFSDVKKKNRVRPEQTFVENFKKFQNGR